MTNQQLDQTDVVISSRIRLARNIADFPFVSTCSDDQRAEIETTVRNHLAGDNDLEPVSFVDSIELEALERQFLLDLKLVSVPPSETNREPDSTFSEYRSLDDTTPEGLLDSVADLLPSDFSSSEIENPSSESSSLTINEEDHLRITVTRNDLNLSAAWDQISQIDDRIEQHLNYAFSPRWGYLTACPANVGTGMRVSVLVHLPALVLTGQADKVFRMLQKINVVARGVFGESAIGDFFRISNQATLGIKESDLIDQVANVIPELVKYERQAREFLLAENREGLRRDVAKSLERLCQWDLDDESDESKEQVLSLLSKVRMGVGIGLLQQTDADRVSRLFLLVQLRDELVDAVAREDYQHASRLRDQIHRLEQRSSRGSTSKKWADPDDDQDIPFGVEFDENGFDDRRFNNNPFDDGSSRDEGDSE